MADQLALLLTGFLLTGVLGGGLGYFFQRRAWTHQYRVERRDEGRRQASNTFEEVSRLLDRRLYRMRLVYWAAKRRTKGGGTAQLSTALDGYRAVLLEWNDNLNRILALVTTFFGGGIRRQLEVNVYEEYAAIGRALDELVRQVSDGRTDVELPPLGSRLTALGGQVYRLNTRMLTLLQLGQIGESAPQGNPDTRPALPTQQLGHSGAIVRRLQRALRRAGLSPGTIDGEFGRATEQALREFQRSRALDPDGIAGSDTWNALSEGEPMPVLREGSHGDIVAAVQEALIEYAPHRWETAPRRVDGIFGSDTADAVKAFQRWHGLSADGVVGDLTWTADLDSATTLESRAIQ